MTARSEKVRALFDAVDRNIESGRWTEPQFDELLRELEGAISETYGPSSYRSVPVAPAEDALELNGHEPQGDDQKKHD